MECQSRGNKRRFKLGKETRCGGEHRLGDLC